MNLSPNETIYQIFIDRFAKGNGEEFEKDIDQKPVFAGGNLRGVIDHLDHIVSLGATAIWLSPFSKTSAYHGYHVTDFFSVEPRFGTEDDLRDLVDLVHSRGLKIIADFVPNHVSHLHPLFLEAENDVASPYRDWFYFNYDNSYMCFLHYKELPKLNLENPDTRKHVTDAARHWLSFGFDGFRFDHVCGASDNFWKEFIPTLKKEFPQASFFGEAAIFGIAFSDVFTLKMGGRWLSWLFGDTLTMEHYRKILPGILDFKYATILRLFASKKISAKSVQKKLDDHRKDFPDVQTVSFLDNHDMDRVMFIAKNNVDMFKKTITFLVQEKRPIVIYQGTEFGVSQEKAMKNYKSYADLAVRKVMPWESLENELHLFVKKSLQERKDRAL